MEDSRQEAFILMNPPPRINEPPPPTAAKPVVQGDGTEAHTRSSQEQDGPVGAKTRGERTTRHSAGD